MSVQPVLLSYDDLPPGSDIRREYHGELVKITVPAGEPPAAAKRVIAQAALVSGAISSWAFLLLALIVFGYFVRMNRIAGGPLNWAIAFFAIFCTAIVALVSWVRYGMKLEDLQAGRRQATVIAVTPRRLVVETSGPFDVASYDIPEEQLVGVSIGRAGVRDADGRLRKLDRLVIQLAGGRRIPLLPGRDRTELRWVARAIGRAMGVSVDV
ncbi:MAG TPA: hypothetical protein VGR35_10160 [Tepidisphaeraceae bacterium]|nr:hypothetical protein [Tepidisphaeraceae bacterium]